MDLAQKIQGAYAACLIRYSSEAELFRGLEAFAPASPESLPLLHFMIEEDCIPEFAGLAWAHGDRDSIQHDLMNIALYDDRPGFQHGAVRAFAYLPAFDLERYKEWFRDPINSTNWLIPDWISTLVGALPVDTDWTLDQLHRAQRGNTLEQQGAARVLPAMRLLGLDPEDDAPEVRPMEVQEYHAHVASSLGHEIQAETPFTGLARALCLQPVDMCRTRARVIRALELRAQPEEYYAITERVMRWTQDLDALEIASLANSCVMGVPSGGRSPQEVFGLAKMSSEIRSVGDHVTLSCKLTEGGAGTVYGGIYKIRDSTYPIAVKMYRNSPNNPTLNLRKQFRGGFDTILQMEQDGYWQLKIAGIDRLADLMAMGIVRTGSKDGDYCYMITLMNGPTLEWASSEGLTPHQFRQVADSLLETLRRMHEKGIVHRDIHPGNVYSVERTVIGDFATVARVRPQMDCVFGHPAYASPEAVWDYMQNERKTHPPTHDPKKNDVFMLGMTLHQVLYGRLPLQHGDIQHYTAWRKRIGRISNKDAVCSALMRATPQPFFRSVFAPERDRPSMDQARTLYLRDTLYIS